MRLDPEILEQEPMPKILDYLLKNHDSSTPATLSDYYAGGNAILSRQMADATKPNNRLVHNLPAYITDTIVGYFMGKPVSYVGDDAYIEALNEIYDSNHEQDHNSELAKGQSICGAGYEMLYTNEEAKIKMVEVPRQNIIYVESANIEAAPILAVRLYTLTDLENEDTSYYEVLTDTEVITYQRGMKQNQTIYTEINRYQHFFGGVPVVEYKNNKERLGDFQGVLTLIDAYDLAQSDTANDFEYFTDAYLKMTGATLDPEQIKTMKENRVIVLPDKECSVDWLIKQVNDVATENFKNRVREDIHTLSKCPDLTADEFGTALSGVAIAYRMMNLEQICATKERKFKKGLQRRLELITNVMNTQGKQWRWQDIEIQFSRNLPQNLKEIAEIVGMLAGRIDDETLISLLPFVEDPAAILEKLRAQKEEAIDISKYMDDEEEAEEEVGEKEAIEAEA